MYDVVVIGAGPGGNMSALRLAQSGHRVAVLDWRRDIGDKLCTGIIGRECVDRFPPDSSLIYHESCSATVVSPNGKRFPVAKEQPQAFIVNRVAYVNSIAQQAQESGAEYFLECRVRDIQISKSEVAIETNLPNQESLQAKVIVLASGFGSPLLRMVGLGNSKAQEYMIGCQAEVIAKDLEETEVYTGDKIAPESFAWMVPLADSRALVGMAPRRKLNGHMDELLGTLQQQGRVQEVIRKPQTWGIPIKPISKTYSDRVLAVGDAAGLVKPTTGGGIYYAFLSGELAAETLHEALEANDLSSKRLRSYERAWKDVFGRELRVGYYARLLFEALNDEQIECLLEEFLSEQVLNEVVNAPDFSFDWHGKAIMRIFRHANMRKVVRSFGPAIGPMLARLIRSGR